MMWTNGARYEGEFRNGLPHGRGVYRYDDGGRYEGQLAAGKRQGSGVYTWASGAVYQGRFENDYRSGMGTMRYSDGRVFEGEWKHNEPFKGRMRYPDGTTYEGSFFNAEPAGRGTFRDRDRVRRSTVLDTRDFPEQVVFYPDRVLDLGLRVYPAGRQRSSLGVEAGFLINYRQAWKWGHYLRGYAGGHWYRALPDYAAFYRATFFARRDWSIFFDAGYGSFQDRAASDADTIVLEGLFAGGGLQWRFNTFSSMELQTRFFLNAEGFQGFIAAAGFSFHLF
jgi:hypothetical protein